MTRTRWRFVPDADYGQICALLMHDPVWNSFALADIEASLRPYSQFPLAFREGGPMRGRGYRQRAYALCLILRHPLIGEVISPFGQAAGLSLILEQLALPEHPLLHVQEPHLPIVERYYRPETHWRPMLRMAVAQSEWFPAEPPLPLSIKQLTAADLPALEQLYARNSEAVFAPSLFDQGLYVGVYEGSQIVAAAGTHAIVPLHRLAALGHIYTAPDARRKGYATRLISTLLALLFGRGCSLVVLNVFEENAQARGIYQRLGFRVHYRFLTGKATLL
jgi:RimJ/RimL family protein N-acetyltransferase